MDSLTARKAPCSTPSMADEDIISRKRRSISVTDSPTPSKKKSKRKLKGNEDSSNRSLKSATRVEEEDGKRIGVQWRNLELSLKIESKEISAIRKVKLVYSHFNLVAAEDTHDVDQAGDISLPRLIVRVSLWIQSVLISSEDKMRAGDKILQSGEDSVLCLDCRCWEIFQFCLVESSKLGISLSLSGNLLRVISFVARNAKDFLNDVSVNQKDCSESEGFKLYRMVYDCVKSMFFSHNRALKGSMDLWMVAVDSVLELATKIFAEDLGSSESGKFFIDLSCSILEPFSKFVRAQRWRKNGFRDFVDTLLEPLFHVLGLMHYHEADSNNAQGVTNLIEEIISYGLFHPSHMDEFLSLQGLGKYSSSYEDHREPTNEIRSYHRHLFEKLLDIVSKKKECALAGAGELFRLFVKQVKNQKGELSKAESLKHLETKTNNSMALEPSPQSCVASENNNSSNSSLRKSSFEFLVQIMDPLLLEIELYVQSVARVESPALNARSVLRSINKMLSTIICEKMYVRTEDISEGACINFLKLIYGLIMSCCDKVIRLMLSSSDSNEIEQINTLALIAEELVVAMGYIIEIEYKVIDEGLVDLWLIILAFMAAGKCINKNSELCPLMSRTVVLSCQLVNLYKDLREASHAVFALCKGLRYLSFSETKDDEENSLILSAAVLHNEVILKSAELLMRSWRFRMTIHEALKTVPEGQGSNCFHTLILDLSESLDWKRTGFSAIVGAEAWKGNLCSFNLHAESLGKVFSEIYSLVLDSIPITSGNSSSIGDALNKLITVLQPIMSSFVASAKYRTRGVAVPSMGLLLNSTMLDACHWILVFFFRVYVSCRSLFGQVISLLPPRSAVKMNAVLGSGFTKYSGMDWIKSDDITKEGYFSWISQSSSSLLALIESIRRNLDGAHSADSPPLIYLLHSMVVQRLVDLNSKITSVQYLLQDNSSISSGKRENKLILSDLKEEAASLTSFIMKSLSLVDLEELDIAKSGEETSNGSSWDMGVCSLDDKKLPTAVWWIICQNAGVWSSHATEKELEMFLSILIGSELCHGCPSQETVNRVTIDSSDVINVTLQQISFELLQDASFYELSFVCRFLAPNICCALMNINSFPEWVGELHTLENSYVDEEKRTVSFSNNGMIEEYFKGGGLFPSTSFQFKVCQNLLNLMICMPKRSLTTDSFLHYTRFLLNLERAVVRSLMDNHLSLQLHSELFRLLVCCRRALKHLIIAFSVEKSKSNESFGSLLFGESSSHALWLLKSAAMVAERVNSYINCDSQGSSMILSFMDHTAGVFMTLAKYYYSCSGQLHINGINCKGSASMNSSSVSVNTCSVINMMTDLLCGRLNNAVKCGSIENKYDSIDLNKISSLLSCIHGFLRGLAASSNNRAAGNGILSVDRDAECDSISKIHQLIVTTSEAMDSILKRSFLIDDVQMMECICNAQGIWLESSVLSSCHDGKNSENLDLEAGQVVLTLPEFDSASEGGIWKNLLERLLDSEKLDSSILLRELFIAYSAILRLSGRKKCSPLPSSLMKFLLGVLQETLSRFANMEQVPNGFWLVLDGALQFMEELGYQYASNYLTMSTNEFVKLVTLQFKAIGKCISLQQNMAKLVSPHQVESGKSLSSQLEGLVSCSFLAIYGVDELKARLRMSVKMLIKNSSECHLKSAMHALERALIGVREVCTMIYEITLKKNGGGTVSPTIAAGIDCLDMILDCVEGRLAVKEKLQSLTASLFNIVIHLQGPSIFYRELFTNIEEDSNPDPGSVVLMCVEVLTRVVRKDTLFQKHAGHQTKNKFKIDIGQFARLPAALFQDFCHLKFQNSSAAPNSSMSPTANAHCDHLVNRQFSLDLYAACCQLLCAAVKHRHSECVKQSGLLQYSVQALLNCLEMAGTDSADRNGYFTWTLEEGIKCACFLQRVYEELGQQKQFKEHCYKFLSSYISAYSGFGPLRTGLKREIDEAMRPGVYALIDACSEQNLQCLHTEFGEGPCRSILASLKNDYKLNFQYQGKV